MMCTKCVMIMCTTMQSALLRYLSYKYYYSILSMMIMPREGMVCFIVFFDNRNIVLVRNTSLYLNYCESYMIILMILRRPFSISRSKRILQERQLHIGPDIIMGCYPCTIKRETNFYQQKQGYPHDYRTTLILQTKIRKNTLHPSILGFATRRHHLPLSILGVRV